MRLFDRAFTGSDEMFALAEAAVTKTIDKLGADAPVAFGSTAYFLPCIYAYTGRKITKLSELKDVLEPVKGWLTRNYRLNDVFTSGIATVLAAEIIEACKYAENPTPYEEKYHGHMTDAEVRELGVPLVTQDIPGFVVIIDEAPTDAQAQVLIKGYQSRGIFVFLLKGAIDQAERCGIKMGFPVRIVPVGPGIEAVSHIISVVVRAAFIFGNVQPGDWEGFNKYSFERIFAFVNAFGPLENITVGCGAGAIAMGFPVITNDTVDVDVVPKSLIIQTNIDDLIETSLEARDIKIKVSNIDLPVACASAFEGEIIRKADMFCEADGSRKDCFELVRTKELHEVEDHKIELIGQDFDAMEVGCKINLAIIIDIAGKNMQSDFEPVFERKIHNYVNCLEGVMHTGQRDLIRIRVSKSSFEAGFRVKHFGELLYAKMKNDFSQVVDKCQVTLVTEPELVTKLRKEANEIYDKRDARLRSLTDESVECFYTCTLCQSFSPSHVCIVTPERLGLCGAVSWLDAKSTNELQPSGPCQVVTKTKVIDEAKGAYEDVNEAVSTYSHGALDKVTLYSIMEDPMTSCGCFECICGIEPMSNGVIIVNREYAGSTPLGMTFAELASMTGGGVQTPGFMGHGRHFIASKKFMKAEGGIARIVWMPKALKDSVAERLNISAKELYGIDNFTDRIADESISEDPDTLMAYLSEKGHPALEMEPMM
ncbi:acetyl-CoA decarbonylase/synthase beta subunit [Sporobacter termitidis DSM 10068]|uniref:CO-methylating acetyl-CoA synthase n=1 Tax=Sporobacter termitidis DSM 10068 TaxID=1123282 RepID=A0A1M5Z248_9FIRM|nr:acetyl-CoA decarbonylase/synthase complex subunit alpha/beta [Sporobacter termitidis]SHI18327.1 acetyl-CoA decarbonylase/synthase beta subunit [Sporobacter termitidis DSM 10068]